MPLHAYSEGLALLAIQAEFNWSQFLQCVSIILRLQNLLHLLVPTYGDVDA